jgi:hypothetical protein
MRKWTKYTVALCNEPSRMIVAAPLAVIYGLLLRAI